MTDRKNIKLRRKLFALEWAEKLRGLGIDDPCGLPRCGSTEYRIWLFLWDCAGREAKRRDLYAKSTYFRDAAMGLRGMAQVKGNR